MAAPRLGLQVLQFSTSVVRPGAKLIKPPIQVYGVEGRYATAPSAASKQKKLDLVEQELGKESSLIRDPKLLSLAINPNVKCNIKQKTFTDALTTAEVSPITFNLINVLADNGRLTLTADVISAFSKMRAHRREVIWSVTRPQTLDKANLAELKVALNGFLQKGETLKLESKSDPTILGGIIVSIGDT